MLHLLRWWQQQLLLLLLLWQLPRLLCWLSHSGALLRLLQACWHKRPCPRSKSTGTTTTTPLRTLLRHLLPRPSSRGLLLLPWT